jgi:hypothetical protein
LILYYHKHSNKRLGQYPQVPTLQVLATIQVQATT